MVPSPLKRWVSDERGALTPLMVVLLSGIILMTGVALDLARHESERADLQDALDRGVLAAASLSQSVDPQSVVEGFVANRGMSSAVPSIQVGQENALNYRRVAAIANYQLDTLFLRLAGLRELPVFAHAAAVQRLHHVEISLVLDISGSMARERTGGTNLSRLEVLRDAASRFVEVALTDFARPLTTISLVPYAGQVNAGAMFGHFNTSRVHNYSSCTEFTTSDFNTTQLPAEGSRAQVPHFQWFNFEGDSGHEAEWGWCPSDQQAIVPFSNDPDALKIEIAQFVGHDGTGTQNGLKWGIGLLDPTTQPLVQSLSDAGIVNSDFADRPVGYTEPNALKFIVLMTDGNIRYQQRPTPSAYNTASERAYWASNKLTSSYATLNTSSKRADNEDDQVDNFLELCSRAKQAGIIVFTIGFDVDQGTGAYNEMRSCASSVGHFYDVDGLDLTSAFQQIASTIERLKLVE